MVLAKLDKIKKYYGDKLILDIKDLEILEQDRIGIVGQNGAGMFKWHFVRHLLVIIIF